MTNTNASDGSQPGYVRRTLRQAWRDLLSVYYANTTIWRYLKSGALLWFGLMIWAFSNLLLSYRPEWTVLYVVMAYGFVLVLWGPLTHFVVVPLVIRLRREGDSSLARTVARHGSKLNLTVFFTIVILLAALPFGPMVLEFQPGAVTDGDDSPSPTADLECVIDDDVVQCALTDEVGYDHVAVMSDGEDIMIVTDPPYAFELEADDHDQFVVELRDEDGAMLDRFVERTAGLSEAETS
ncbi:hypothetical protein D8Y22_01725 [Salinadaptatus halalkaliphilus]|uniref:Uncharacterized protein n=1 Tax=Salinadaptatus halalkaliphilus TaxID=2419781 RepID=A0A4S3TQ97_9EURY|nr:hypothetical protein [Salinadaptatus halalkaliphilus]THE66541.1 hypothetical protein D8Y22_01725 [Salinadaptatus halalkaliphilus]